MANIDFMQILFVATPAALTFGAGCFFVFLGHKIKRANRNTYLRYQALTGSALNAVTGSVGCDLADGVTSDIDRGFCSKEEGGTLYLARQGKLPRDTIANMI